MTKLPRPSVSRRVLNVALPVVLIAGVGVYLYNKREQFEPLADVTLGSLLLVAALVVVAHFINALQFGRLYRSVGADIGPVESWMLFTAGQLGNYLPAQAGTVYRFHYLRQRFGLDLGSVSAGYAANLLITILASGAVGLVGAVWFGASTGEWPWILIAGLAGLVGLGSLAALIELPASASTSRFGQLWQRFRRGWTDIRADRAGAFTVLGLEVLRSVLTAWRLQFTFAWVGFDQPLALFLIIGPTAALVTFVGITPAGLGLRELAMGVIASLAGQSFAEGLAGSSVDRALNLAIVGVLGLAGLLYTTRRLRTAGLSGTAPASDVAHS